MMPGMTATLIITTMITIIMGMGMGMGMGIMDMFMNLQATDARF